MLEAVQTRIEQLIALYETERAENQSLRLHLEALSAENDDMRKQIAELDGQIANLKLKEAFVAPASDNSEAKAKIAKMIKDIDKCIKLLES